MKKNRTLAAIMLAGVVLTIFLSGCATTTKGMVRLAALTDEDPKGSMSNGLFNRADLKNFTIGVDEYIYVVVLLNPPPEVRQQEMKRQYTGTPLKEKESHKLTIYWYSSEGYHAVSHGESFRRYIYGDSGRLAGGTYFWYKIPLSPTTPLGEWRVEVAVDDETLLTKHFTVEK